MGTFLDWLHELNTDQLISLFQAFATLILGISAGFIAFNQYRVNRKRLAMELYDREVEVVKEIERVFRKAEVVHDQPMPEQLLIHIMPELKALFPQALAWEILFASEKLGKKFALANAKAQGVRYQLPDEDIDWAHKKYWEFQIRLSSAMSRTGGIGILESLMAAFSRVWNKFWGFIFRFGRNIFR